MGEEVSFFIVHYHSSERVKREFDSRIKDAIEVIKQEENTRTSGVKSEIAVITSKDKDAKTTAIVIINDGSEDLRYITSISLQDILAVEKTLKRSRTQAKP